MKQFTFINTGTMPKQKVSIFHGDLFDQKCPYCHTVASYPYSFTVHDNRTDVPLLYASSPQEKESLLKKHAGEEDVRIVDTMEDMREKFMIFHEGYDDRIMEIEKKMILKAVEKDRPDIKKERFCYNLASRGVKGAVICGEENGQIQFMCPCDEIYHQLEQDINEKTEEYDGETLLVDESWAHAFNKWSGFDDMRMEELQADDASIASFFAQVDQLEMSGQEKTAADLILNQFEDVWEKMLQENPSHPDIMDLDDKYDNVYNAVNELSMILMNEKKYSECMHILKTILDTVDFGKERTAYMNMRRDYMDCIGYTEGFDAKLAYLDKWMKEEPDSPYLYGTEIDTWLDSDKKKASQLAWKYIDTPVKKDEDEWLLDSISNTAVETNDKALQKKVDAAMKKYHRF